MLRDAVKRHLSGAMSPSAAGHHSYNVYISSQTDCQIYLRLGIWGIVFVVYLLHFYFTQMIIKFI